ncbi:MAG: ABC transporter permease [Synergistaceae bacterium]|nr:ABC transporter permease [Synergistota bacterium]NLM72144.1 ABC transporter permease [Synergistaceae bacterium]
MAYDDKKPLKSGKYKEIWRRFKKSKKGLAGLFIILVIFLVSLGADLIVPYNAAIKQSFTERLQPPSANHYFGTDGYGRDLFARVIHGSRNSLSLGFFSTFISIIIGTILGAAAGYWGGLLDNLIMRFLDTIKSIPPMMMALAIVAALGASFTNLLIAITVAQVPTFVRMVRSAVIGISGFEYTEAARAGGTRDMRIIHKHIIPNAMGVIIIQGTMSISAMILQAASLSFIGMGIQPPSPEWGAMLSEAREYMRVAPYFMFFPGIAIILSALSINLLGDGLRDALDPRLKS